MTVPMKRLALAIALAASSVLISPDVRAQMVVAHVNGEPITTYEIEQRMRINRLARQPASRQAALSELIDDRVKLAEARRVGYRVTDEGMDDQISRIAKGNNQTVLEFNQNLSKVGVDMNAYRQKLKAQYAWELAMERRQKGSENPTDMIFTDKGGSGGARIDYTLHSVIFVVPAGTNAGSRMAEANSARARFNDCATGLQMLRGWRDVAVKSGVRRSSDGLSPQLNKILEATPVNRLTPPFPSAQGIEVVAVCEKTGRGGRGGAGGDDAKKKTTDAQAYLKELRAKSVIQYR